MEQNDDLDSVSNSLKQKLATLDGLFALGDNDYTFAERSFRQVLETDPFNHNALINLGAALFLQERYAESSSVYRRCANAYPREGVALLGAGLALCYQGMYREAQSYLRGAVRLTPGEPTTYLHLSGALAYAGDATAALDALSQAELFGAKTYDVEIARARVAVRSNDHSAALGHLAIAGRIRQGVEVRCLLYEVRTAERNYREAHVEASEALRLRPNWWYALMISAQSQIRLGRRREAVPLLERAVEAHPTSPDIFRTLLGLYLRLGLVRKAWHTIAGYYNRCLQTKLLDDN